ncbi:helix-turn-helix domain-containing protein [Kribbella sp. CA-253562]|uniref:helix-turn-helix domain-containing protein n=1 Tax=Kribbella sp. CA-253562 TaxID=3239942 RepID=UPI003D8CEBC8
MTLAPSPEAARLAKRLRGLRISHASKLTQADLAHALSQESSVAVATISSWESRTNPKVPPVERLHSYALFFCSDRSTTDPAYLVPEDELTSDERRRFHDLHEELVTLRNAVHGPGEVAGSSTGGLSTWTFDSDPITIICPEAPLAERPPMANEKNPNYTRMFRYADLDALIELWGHVRACNPTANVVHRLPSEVVADDLSSHVVVLGGVGWNRIMKRMLKTLREMPVSQVEVDDLKTGEIFRTSGPGGREYRPVWDDTADNGRELLEDVALLARVRNPYNHSQTLTICNGIHSRGVVGAVRTLTDIAVRERNEAFLSSRFPGGEFALLLRVPVLNGEALSPDLEIESTRLYEWSPSNEATAE